MAFARASDLHLYDLRKRAQVGAAPLLSASTDLGFTTTKHCLVLLALSRTASSTTLTSFAVPALDTLASIELSGRLTLATACHQGAILSPEPDGTTAQHRSLVVLVTDKTLASRDWPFLGRAQAMAAVPKKPAILVADGNELVIVDPLPGRTEQRLNLKRSRSPIRSVGFCKGPGGYGGQHVWTAGEDGALEVFRCSDGMSLLKSPLQQINAVFSHPESDWLAVRLRGSEQERFGLLALGETAPRPIDADVRSTCIVGGAESFLATDEGEDLLRLRMLRSGEVQNVGLTTLKIDVANEKPTELLVPLPAATVVENVAAFSATNGSASILPRVMKTPRPDGPSALPADRAPDVRESAGSEIAVVGRNKPIARVRRVPSAETSDRTEDEDSSSSGRTDTQFDLERPTSRLDDLVVPVDVRSQIQEIIDAGRTRTKVLDVWHLRRAVGSGVGLTVLLSGKPGTGKTITTEIIAAELGRPLARIDGSKVVSKWVGETQKNLKIALEDAALHGAVLFFDEADALFAKRVAKMESSNDRFANLETNYLLQALERHDGIVVLATNIETAIDDAFKRRLLYKVELPMPDASARAQIWEGILRRSDAPLQQPIDFTDLGKRYALAGGHIKNAILRASHRAAALGTSITHELLDAAGGAELGSTGALVQHGRKE